MSTTPDTERIAALLAAATPEAAAELRDLAENTAEKETRKAARRALYLLSQRHISPPERAASAAVAPTARTGAAEPIRAYASGYDGAGDRAIYLFYSGANGGSPTFLQFLTRDDQGIRDLGISKISRREVADLVGRLEAQLEEGIAFAEIESDYAIHLLHEARVINQRLRTRTPPGTPDWLARLPMPTGDYATPPVYNRLPAADVEADEALPRDPHELFYLPYFEPWFMDVDEVVPYFDRLLAVLPEEENEDARRAAMERGMAEIVNALIVTPTRERYVRRLEETADILLRRGKAAEARQALYHALDLKSDRPAGEVPFATRLVERTIIVAMTMQTQQSES